MNSELEEYVLQSEITDPDTITKVLAYLDDLDLEDEEFIETLVQCVSREIIYWTQPWYQKGSLTRRVVPDTENCEETYRTDRITLDEADIIQRNWQKFRKKYEIPDKLICFVRWKSKDKARNYKRSPQESARRFLTAYLARGLKRTLYQVHRYLLKHCSRPITHHYNKYEEKIIELCIYNSHKTAVPSAAKILHREPRGIYTKMKEILNGKPEKKKIRWTLPLATKFLNLLIQYTGVLSVDDLKYKVIEKSVWLKLENDFDHLYIYLQAFWYHKLHVQLFVRCKVMLNKLRKKMFKRLKKSSIRVWSDIRWKELVKECPDGFTHNFLYTVMYTAAVNVENYIRKPLTELATTVLKNIKKRKHMYKSYRLRTLKLENGELIDVSYA